jgi:glycosyltransferase involved in cell wall biosynthesis
MAPIVSIIIPVYNRPVLVAEAIESVLAQTNPNWELIVVDDGSTDNTWEVLESYAAKDERIRVFKRDREPKGAPTCRNIGAGMARGKYLIFFDSDDLMLPNCLEYRLNWAKKEPDYDAWVFPTGIFIDKPGDYPYQWNDLIKNNEDDLLRFLNLDMPWDVSGPFWNTRNVKKNNWFDENAGSFQDWEMHINRILDGVKYKKIDEGRKSIQCFYRRNTFHGSINTDFNDPGKLKNRALIFAKNTKRIILERGFEKQTRIAVKRFLLFNCTKMVRSGLLKEAKDLWFKEKIKGFFKPGEVLLFWVYLRTKKKPNFLNKAIEFVFYRFLGKKELFERPPRTFMRTEIFE